MDNIKAQNNNINIADEVNTQITDEDGISLIELFKILKNRMFLIIFIAIIFITGAYFYLQHTVPVYEVSTTALVQPLTNSTSLESLMGTESGSSQISTEVELVKSRKTLNASLGKLNLDNYQDSEENLYSALTDSYLSYGALSKRITVSTVKDTNVISVTVSDHNPQFATDFADALMEAYTEILTGMAKNSKSAQREFIEQQIPLNEEAMKEANLKLAEYKQESGVIQMTEKSSILTKQIAYYQMQMEPLKFQQIETEASIKEYNNLYSDKDLPSLDSLKENNEIAINLQNYKDANVELLLYENMSDGSSSLNTDEARVHVLSSNMVAATKNIMNIVSSVYSPYLSKADLISYSKNVTDYFIVKEKLEALQEIDDRYSKEFSEYPELERQQLELQKDVEIYASLNIKLREMLEETKLVEAAVVGNVTVIDSAVVPQVPVSPNKPLVMVVSLLLGLAVGFLLALLIEMTDNSISSEESIKKIVGMNVHSLGWIPFLHFDNKIHKEKEYVKGLVVLNDPNSPESERFKMVANNILYASAEKIQVLQVNSTTMGEGKSSLIANIAAFYATVGKKVLMVDGDLRRPSIERFFNLKHSPKGIVDIVVDETPLEECILLPISTLPNLNILPPGKMTRNPIAIYGSGKFKRLISTLRKEYDIILIDAPPASYAAETVSISQNVDGVILNIRTGVATKGGLKDLIQSFRFVRCNILGYIYYGVIAEEYHKRYGSYSSYNYGYNSYYSGKKHKKKKIFWGRRAYKRAYKKEIKIRRTEKLYGTREPVLAFSKGELSGPAVKIKEEKKQEPESKTTMDFLADIESDGFSKGKRV